MEKILFILFISSALSLNLVYVSKNDMQKAVKKFENTSTSGMPSLATFTQEYTGNYGILNNKNRLSSLWKTV